MEEIVRRLRNRDQKSINSLKESLPVKGISEDEELPAEEELPADDELEDEIPEEDGLESPDEEIDTEESPDTLEDPAEAEADPDHVNPLDNAYAVNYQIGQQVILTYSNGAKTKLAGTIDGYDKEGFYRIKWANGKTTSGLTDIALADLIEETNESTCVCGSTKFVNEGKSVVCDKCGRYIRESIALPDAEQSKSKRKIRSEVHPMSTSIPECDTPKKSIQSSIRKAFTKKMNEEEDYDNEDPFNTLKSQLDREFWTRLPELVADIEELGYDVYEANNEYVVVATEYEGEDYQLYVPIGGTARTMTLDLDRARKE